MTTPKPAQSPSEAKGTTSTWATLSIRERIQAMNKTLDIVEEKQRTATPNSGLLLRFSTSEETFPSNSTDAKADEHNQSVSGNPRIQTAPLPPSQPSTSRSSVVDIWRSRETVSPGVSSRKTVTSDEGARPRLSALPLPSKSRLSDTEAKEHSTHASTEVPQSLDSLPRKPVSASTRAVKTFSPPAIHKAENASADFTIVPAAEAHSPASSSNKRSRLTALWERTGAGNSVAEAKQRLGIVESSRSTSSPYEKQGISRRSPRASLSTPHGKDGQPRPVSRTGTVSPADTLFSTGTADTKRSTVTDIWELRCRMHASESTKNKDADRPSSVPPPSSSSPETKRIDRSSFPQATNKSRGEAALSKTTGRALPPAVRPVPPTFGKSALKTRKQSAATLGAAKSEGEAVSLSGVAHESRNTALASPNVVVQGSNSISTSWRHQSVVSRREKTETQLSVSDLADQPRKSNVLRLSSIPSASSPRSNEGAIAATQPLTIPGSGSDSHIPKQGSVADRWKGATGDTRLRNNALQRDSKADDQATVLSASRQKVSDRWNHRMDEPSTQSGAANEPSGTKSLASLEVSRRSGASVISERAPTELVSRWNEIAKSAGCQGSPTSKSPQLLRSESQALPHHHKETQSFVTERLGSLCPVMPSVEADINEGKTKPCQASPTFRRNYRKVADHWLKMTSDATATDSARRHKPSHHAEVGKQISTTGVTGATSNGGSTSTCQLPSPRARATVRSYAKRFIGAAVENNQGNAAISTLNMVKSVRGDSSGLKQPVGEPVGQGDRQDTMMAPNEKKATYVKTVTVSSPDAVEVVQRGDFGGELSRRVLADALSNDSLAPEEDFSTSKPILNGQARDTVSEDADEHSDESKQKPAKIIKSWNVRVYQTEQMPSSPRFSRHHTTLDLQTTETVGGQKSLNPKSHLAIVPTSSSSAFNTWNATLRPEDGVSKSSVKTAPRVSEKHKRDFVSLGRRHIVHGLVSKNGPARRDNVLTGNTPVGQPNEDATLDVVQSTSTDDSVSVVLGSPSRNGLAAIECDDPSGQHVNSMHHDSMLIAGVAFQGANDTAAPSSKRKVVSTRKHLPSPIIRRKKMAREAVITPAVANNLSDIVEVRSEDSNLSGPLSPRTKELNLKKRELQAQRRKHKVSMKDAIFTDSSQHSTTEEDSDSLPPGRRNPLVAANLEQRSEPKANECAKPIMAQTGYPTLEINTKGKRVEPSLPRSPVSDVDFSFLTDAHSVNSGMTSILSAGSLSNRAERLLTGRKREQRKATGPAFTITENRQPSPSIPVTKLKNQLSQDLTHRNPQESQATILDTSASSTKERPRLETRYNTTSRFLDPAKISTHRDRESQDIVRANHRAAAEQICTTESNGSSYQSADSISDESDLRQPAKRHSRSSRSRKSRKSIAQQPSVASEQFLAENAANFTAFSTAYKRFSLRDIANDLAGEIKLLGIDTTGFASTVNSKIALCVNETKKAKSCHEYLGFGDEDVAIEVEFMEEELDEDASNSIEDDDYDDSTLEEPANIQQRTRSMCAPLGYHETQVS